MAAIGDIDYKRGDTEPITITIKDSSGSAVDITGWTLLFTVDQDKAPTNEDNQQFQLTGVLTDAANGIVSFEPSASNTDLLGTYYYEIQRTDSGGKIKTLTPMTPYKIKFYQDMAK